MIVSQPDADPGWTRRRVKPALPGRPDLDQLRRQARELLRAAAANDEQALRRIRMVSQKQTLSAAQLAIAREYSFASWPKLRAEVLGRQATEPDAGAVAVAGTVAAPDTAPSSEPAPKSWLEMREWCARLLESRTGQGLVTWNERIAAATPHNRADEPALRKWLSAEGVTGYAQSLLVWETFGYPGFLVADADELIGKQYADRPQLRPVFDAVLRILPELPGPVTVQARGTLVSLVSPRRTFAVLKPTTKSASTSACDSTRLSPREGSSQQRTSARPPSGTRSALPARWTTRSGPCSRRHTRRTPRRQPGNRARRPGPSPSLAR
jgi:hypothetical protein